MRLRFPFLAACASFACIGAAADTPADEGGDKPATEIDSIAGTPESGERSRDYWTAERMRNAKPMPKPVLDLETLKRLEPSDPTEPTDPE